MGSPEQYNTVRGNNSMCDKFLLVIPSPAMAYDLGSELFIAAKVIGSTLSSMVDQVALSQGNIIEFS